MKCFSERQTSSLSRALVAAAIALAALPGCKPDVEAPHDLAEAAETTEGPTGETRSALGVTYYDFIANAPGAAWSNNDGGIPWGTNSTTRGGCYTATAVLENDVSSPYLRTDPKWSANAFIRASYTVRVPDGSQHPTATATFGFLKNASTTDGVTFSLKTQVNGNWVTLFSQHKTYTGALTTKTADLTPYAGQTLQLFLTAEAGPSYLVDLAAWTDARIVTDSAVPPSGGCTIAGVNWASGQVNPAIACEVCDTNTSTTSWTIRGDTCRIGSQCFAADVELGGVRCDPLMSQTTWTPKAQWDNLPVATTTTTALGNWSSGNEAYADTTCALNGLSLGLPGTWKALYSDPAPLRHYKDTVPAAFGSKPVVNLKGEQLFASWDSIFTNPVWPAGPSMYALDGSAYSGTVWTGTLATGLANTDVNNGSCFTWLVTGGTYKGDIGDFSQRKLFSAGAAACNQQRRFACILLPPGATTLSTVVTVQNHDGTALGTIQGQAHRDALAWRAVPYAAAPTGSLRLAPPAKATSWTGSRPAFAQPPPCPQPSLLPPPVGAGMIGSEDCLYLNVWAPKTATSTSALPVLVYQFGGGHIFGGTASADDWLAQGFLDGDRFASARNAVVVTIQTRTGALGWLTDPALAANATSRTSTTGGGTSGNYGLLDAIQSLKWVKRNIAQFGGDPNKVTFFGESSGATIVCDLLASPLAKDPADNKPYFSSVIMESGFCENPLATYRQTQATPIITSIGCSSAPDKVACLRAASVQSFVNTEGAVLQFFPFMFGQSLPPEKAYGLTFGPHVDGYVLPTHPRLMFAAGTHNKVPTIVGTNKDEATFFMLFMVGGILTGDLPNLIILPQCSDYVAKTDINLGTTLATAARSLYACVGLPSVFNLLGPTLAYAQAITHVQYECPARRTARALDLGQTQNVYRYWFTHGGDNIGVFHNVLGLIREVGASHTFEIPFIFNTHSTMLWYWPTSRERALTTSMQSYWRNFANSGDPNYAGGVNWPAYNRALDNTLKLEVDGLGGIQVQNGINTAKCDFWDDNFNLDGWK